mgnify:CR=1 FL=1
MALLIWEIKCTESGCTWGRLLMNARDAEEAVTTAKRGRLLTNDCKEERYRAHKISVMELVSEWRPENY